MPTTVSRPEGQRIPPTFSAKPHLGFPSPVVPAWNGLEGAVGGLGWACDGGEPGADAVSRH